MTSQSSTRPSQSGPADAGVQHPLHDAVVLADGQHRPHPIRIAIDGKGGVGKTTVAGVLARVLARDGQRVLAIDAAPEADLASALPLDSDERRESLARQTALMQTPEPAADGLSEQDADLGQRLSKVTVTWGGGHPLVTLGRVRSGAEDSHEHALLQQLLAQALELPSDIILIDSEAGLEHISRGTIRGVDLVLVVVEPGQRSFDTALSIRQLAADLGIQRVHAVVCGYRDRGELLRMRCWLGDWPPAANFPYDEGLRAADLAGTPPELSGDFLAAAELLAANVIEHSGALRRTRA